MIWLATSPLHPSVAENSEPPPLHIVKSHIYVSTVVKSAMAQPESVFLFWITPVGGFVVSLLLTYPDRESCTGGLLNQRCNNFLGFEALTLSSAQSWVLAAGVGVVGACVVALYNYLTTPDRPTHQPPTGH